MSVEIPSSFDAGSPDEAARSFNQCASTHSFPYGSRSFAPPQLSGMLFLFLGMLMLASWNFYLTTIGWFISQFPGTEWAFLASVVYQAANVFGTSLMVKFGYQLNFKITYVVSLGIQMILVAALPMLALRSGSSNGDKIVPSAWGFRCALASCGALGLGESVFCSLIFGLGGALGDPKVMQRIMAGQGVVGILCPILMLSFQFISGDPLGMPYEVVLAFFGCCLALQFVGLCIVNVIPAVPVKHASFIVHAVHTASFHSNKGGGSQPTSAAALVPDAEEARHMQLEPRGLGKIIRDAFPQLLNIFLVFVVTFVVFPSVATTWTPQLPLFAEHKGGKGIYIQIVMGVFQVFDVVGRSSTGFLVSKGCMSERYVWIPTWMRLLFVPIFIVLQRYPTFFPAPYQDFVEYGVMAMFAMTNGWCGTMSMMYGPQQVTAAAEQHTVGIMMELGLVGGIFIGTLLALTTQIGVSGP